MVMLATAVCSTVSLGQVLMQARAARGSASVSAVLGCPCQLSGDRLQLL